MIVYRITFHHKMDYGNLQAESSKHFSHIHKHYGTVKRIKDIARHNGIKYIWHFYEPHIEITWYQDEESDSVMNKIIDFLESLGILDYKKQVNKTGKLADWFCHNEQEREFGGKCHSLCSDMVGLFDEYDDAICNGKGIQEQVKRTIHRLCNPLGINYKDEARICFSRGLICTLFRFFSFKKAVWIYRNIFRQKY